MDVEGTTNARTQPRAVAAGDWCMQVRGRQGMEYEGDQEDGWGEVSDEAVVVVVLVN